MGCTKLLGFAHIVNKVSYHASSFDEGQTYNEVCGDVTVRNSKKGCHTAFLYRIRQVQVNVKTNGMFSGDWLCTVTSNNAGQGNGCIIFGEVYLLEDVWVLTNHCRNEVKVGGAEGGAQVEDTFERWAVLLLH
jgi:hypothetical protein